MFEYVKGSRIKTKKKQNHNKSISSNNLSFISFETFSIFKFSTKKNDYEIFIQLCIFNSGQSYQIF